jgi:hypothetical protein
LPERQDLGSEIDRLLAYLREGRVLAGVSDELLCPDHPFTVSVISLLDDFREAYWVAARTLMGLADGGTPRRAIVQAMQKKYRTGLLLGEVRTAEGNSSVTLGNALNRFEEMGCIRTAAAKGKEVNVEGGERFAELPAIANRIRAALTHV